jgi:hypothetical protein
MVELVLVPRSAARLPSTGRERVGDLRNRVERLDPDDALFVGLEGLSPVEPGFRREILSLRTYLRNLLIGLSVTILEDYEKAGAWIYKRRAIPGIGIAIGPEKEAEVRRRPVSPIRSRVANHGAG